MSRYLAILSVCAAFGCMTGRGFPSGASGAPTCEAVCDYYTSCRKLDDAEVRTACVSECKDIYYEDGKPDTRSLRQFQRLDCHEAVAFIEGPSGRPPGRPISKETTQ